MKRISWKCLAPYAPLPAILAGVSLACANRMPLFPLLLRCILLILGYFAAVQDLRKQLVPNHLTLLMLSVWVLVMAPQLFWHTQETIPLMVSGLAGALLSGTVFLTVYLISRGGLGGGDVKFMTAAGLYLGFNHVLSVMLVGSILAAVTGIILIAVKKLDRKGAIALVPFLYVGIVLTSLLR